MAGSTTPAPSSTSTSIVFHTTTVPSILDNLDSSDTVIDDTSLQIVYFGSWTQNLSEGGVPSKTSHNTLVKGSNLVVTFSGTGIDVIGLNHIGGNIITFSVSIDGGEGQGGSVSGTQIGIADQTYFSVRDLENKQHTLKLTVGDGVGPRLFSIDCFVVTTAGASSGAVTSSPTTESVSILTASGVTATTTGTAAVTGSGGTGNSTIVAATASGPSIVSSSGTLGLDLSSISPGPSPSDQGSAASSTASSPVDPNAPISLSASSDNHMSAGQIAGTVIGTLLGIALLIAFFLTLCRWRAIKKRKYPPKLDTMPSPLFTNASDTASVVERGGFRHEKNNPEYEEMSPPEYEFVAREDHRVVIPYYRPA